MPAIAAIDNETLDHLLSVVDDARNVLRCWALSKDAHAEKGPVAVMETLDARPVQMEPAGG